MKHLRLLIFIPALLLSACAKDSFTIQKEPTSATARVTEFTGLDRYETISYFNSLEGQACYNLVSEVLDQEYLKQIREESNSGISDAAAMAKEMRLMASDSMKYASHMVAYSNGVQPIPTDFLAVLAMSCQRNGFYDLKMAQSENRYKLASKVTDGFFRVLPIALGIDAGKDIAIAGIKAAGNKFSNSGSGNINGGGTQDNRNFPETCAGTVTESGTCELPPPMEEVIEEEVVGEEVAENPEEVGEQPAPDEEVIVDDI